MQLSAVFSAALALAAYASAQATPGFDAVSAPGKDDVVPAGSTYNIKWAPASYTGKITIALLGGNSQGTLVPLSTIATGVDNTAGTYAWAVDASLGTKPLYGLTLTSEANTTMFQYSFPFMIKGSGASSSASGAASSSTAAASSSAAPASSSTWASYSTAMVSVSSAPATSTTTTATENVVTVTTATSTFQTVPASKNGTVVTGTPTATTTGPKSSGTSIVTSNGVANAQAGALAVLGGVAAALLL